jgi:hypothetical protein
MSSVYATLNITVSIRIPFSFPSQLVRTHIFVFLLSPSLTLTHFVHPYTQRSYVALSRQFRLGCVLLCVLFATTLTTLTNHEPSAQHTAQHTAHSSARPPSHRIALHRIISHQVPCISPFNLIAIDDKSPCWEVWYLWSSKLCFWSCLLSAEAGAYWFVIEDFLLTCFTRWQNTWSILYPTSLKSAAFVKWSFSGCWLFHPQSFETAG